MGKYVSKETYVARGCHWVVCHDVYINNTFIRSPPVCWLLPVALRTLQSTDGARSGWLSVSSDGAAFLFLARTDPGVCEGQDYPRLGSSQLQDRIFLPQKGIGLLLVGEYKTLLMRASNWQKNDTHDGID